MVPTGMRSQVALEANASVEGLILGEKPQIRRFVKQ